MNTTMHTRQLERHAPGVARSITLARNARNRPEIDLEALPNVAIGNLWSLGQHRILCGDSTSKIDVNILMKDKFADLMVTDPPYGVRYTGKRLVRQAIRNDDLAGDEFCQFLTMALSASPLKPGGSFYICAPSGPALKLFFIAAAEAGLDVKQTLIWVKNHFVLSRCDYHNKYEMLLYGWKPGAAHYYAGGRKQHTVWEFPKPMRSPLHPTTKPVALVERAILNNSREKEIVYDGFSGSGSTLIACEHTGRICRCLEIEPRYVAITIARWEAETGEKAQLIVDSAISAAKKEIDYDCLIDRL